MVVDDGLEDGQGRRNVVIGDRAGHILIHAHCHRVGINLVATGADPIASTVPCWTTTLREDLGAGSHFTRYNWTWAADI